MKLFIVRDRIKYEGDNIWVFAAESKEQIKDSLKQHRFTPMNLAIDLLSNTSDYTTFQEVWTNT